MIKPILIVDDDEELVESLSMKVRDMGYKCIGATSGKEALKIAATQDFQVAIVDLVMPGMNGYYVLEELKKKKPEMKVIMTTGYGGVEEATESVKRGACEFMKKYKINTDEFQGLLNRVCAEADYIEQKGLPTLEKILDTFSSPIRREIIKLLEENKEMKLVEISREIGVRDHTKVVFHLTHLKEAEFVTVGKQKKHRLTALGKKAVFCLHSLSESYYASLDEYRHTL